MATTTRSAARRLLDARPDTLDFRDLMFTPTLVEVPGQLPRGTHHGDFDDDQATVRATLARVLGREQAARPISFGRTGAGKRSDRERLMRAAQSA